MWESETEVSFTTTSESSTSETWLPTSQSEEQVMANIGFWIVIIFTLCIILGGLIQKVKIPFLQESGVCLVVGIASGFLLRYVVLGVTAAAPIFHFPPSVFFYGFLPPLIFEAGYTMKKRSFFRLLGPILMFAVVGTLITAGIIVAGISFSGSGDTSFYGILLYASLLSAIDPVATLAVISSTPISPLLENLLFGESVLNDAVAIILFSTLTEFDSSPEFSLNLVLSISFRFILLFGGSILVGLLYGLITAVITKHVSFHEHPVYEQTVIILLAYLSYLNANMFRLSGVTSLLFVGIIDAHYVWYNISQESQLATKSILHFMANLFESLIYLFLGFSVPFLDNHFDFKFIFLSLFLCILSRFIQIFGINFILNCTRGSRRALRVKELFFLAFSGLRGAVAYALVLALPDNVPHHDMLITSTKAIIIITTLVLGNTTYPVIKLLKLGRKSNDEEDLDTDDHLSMQTWVDSEEQEEERLLAVSNQSVHRRMNRKGLRFSTIHKTWIKVDEGFLKPLFGGRKRDQETVDEAEEKEDEEFDADFSLPRARSADTLLDY